MQDGLANRLDMGRVQLFEVSGRVNENSVQQLVSALDNAVNAGKTQLILDLSGVEYMNSAGLRALVQLYKQAEERGGALVVTNPSPRISELFELVGLDTIFGTGPNTYPDFSTLFADTRLVFRRQVCHCV